MTALDWDSVERISGHRMGTHDAPCPFCSAFRRAKNQRIKVFRVWREDQDFASFHCCHCGEKGFARRDSKAPRPAPEKLDRVRAQVNARAKPHHAQRQQRAAYLWECSSPIAGTIAETYLRSARGYGGPIPATLRFLPARGEYPPAMIGAFGMAHETEPGVIDIDRKAIEGVHVTRLRADGMGKADTDKAKIMIGHSSGWPLVLAPPNDLMGLAVTEGIEDALSVHEGTGLGVWAAGSASRLPALGPKIPSYIDSLTIFTDDDADGCRFAADLAGLSRDRGIETYRVIADQPWRAQLWSNEGAGRQRNRPQARVG